MKNVQFRIKKYNEGYAVEVLKTTWYGKKYWIHCITYFGLDTPFYYSTFESAIENACILFKRNLIKNSI
jgi:hypothetical protein